MRLLQRARDHLEILDLVERAVIAEAISRPRQADDVEALVEAGAVLFHGQAEAVELGGDRAPADSELEPSAGQEVGRRGLLRQLSGWWSGKRVTAVPMRIRRVRSAMTGTAMRGFDRSENAPPKCSSASQATSKPSESASSMSSNISA